jgi:hypothetical protein
MTPAAILKIKYKSGDEIEFRLESDRLFWCFGRAPECQFRFKSGKISHIHFTILSGAKKHTLVDGFPGRRKSGEVLGKKTSTNGIIFNGTLLTSPEQKQISPSVQGRTQLQHGDKLLLPDETEIEYVLIRPMHLPRFDDTETGEPFTDASPIVDKTNRRQIYTLVRNAVIAFVVFLALLESVHLNRLEAR